MEKLLIQRIILSFTQSVSEYLSGNRLLESSVAESFIYDEISGRFMLVLKIRIENEEWIYEEWTENV